MRLVTGGAQRTKKTVRYWSSLLNKVEPGYDTTQRKYLAVVWAVLLLRLYLQGSRFIPQTDHDVLRWI